MVNSYVQNRRQPSLDDLYRVAEILSVDVRKLLLASSTTNLEVDNLNRTIKVPLVGSVACGMPIFAKENIEAEISISASLLKKNEEYFLLRANGDSMDKAGIMNGDLVLIKQQPSAESGDLIVALIDDEATIKEYCPQSDMIILKPKSNNKKHQPMILTRNFIIQGIVVKVITIWNTYF